MPLLSSFGRSPLVTGYGSYCSADLQHLFPFSLVFGDKSRPSTEPAPGKVSALNLPTSILTVQITEGGWRRQHVSHSTRDLVGKAVQG